MQLTPAALADEILSLPGWEGALPSRQFSGYLDLPGGNKHVHYWLILSEDQPHSDPVTLWLNGGPGCSSLDGLFYEHGPLRFDPKNISKLEHFDYTWAKQSNMLYIEAPVGVGFSYSTDRSDYIVNDDSTAQDNVDALKAFFVKYPEWNTNEFFITGESYGGVYVPTLAEGVLWAEGNATWNGPKLTGIAVGNGCTGTEIGVCGPDRDFYTGEYFATSTGLLGQSLQEEITENCHFYESSPGEQTDACTNAISKMSPLLADINIYDVYGQCITQDHAQRRHKAPVLGSLAAPGGPVECINSLEASAYLTRADVIKAINVQPVPDWSVCGTVDGWDYTSTRPNLPRDTYPFLIDNIRVIIYNGDFDACVPWTDNLAWTEGMKKKVVTPWHPWTYDGKNGPQIAGYANVYEKGFTFVTVRGGRHEVPESAPEAAFELLHRLLTGKGF